MPCTRAFVLPRWPSADLPETSYPCDLTGQDIADRAGTKTVCSGLPAISRRRTRPARLPDRATHFVAPTSVCRDPRSRDRTGVRFRFGSGFWKSVTGRCPVSDPSSFVISSYWINGNTRPLGLDLTVGYLLHLYRSHLLAQSTKGEPKDADYFVIQSKCLADFGQAVLGGDSARVWGRASKMPDPFRRSEGRLGGRLGQAPSPELSVW